MTEDTTRRPTTRPDFSGLNPRNDDKACPGEQEGGWWGLLSSRTPDHDEHHFEAGDGFEGVGVVGGHDDGLAGFDAVVTAVNGDDGFAINDVDQGVKRGQCVR